MISKKIESLLNDQIKYELNASNFYLSMGSWCDAKGFEGTANFFYQQSDEERFHAMKIVQFINSLDGHAIAPEVKKPPENFDAYRKLFELSLEHEQQNSAAIHDLVEASLEAKDYSTYNFLHWFLDEQVEEEDMFRTIIDKLNILGDDKSGLYLLDKELGERQADTPAEGQ